MEFEEQDLEQTEQDVPESLEEQVDDLEEIDEELPDDQAEEAEESDEAGEPAGNADEMDQRFGQLESQMGQLTQALGQLVGLVQKTQAQPGVSGQTAPSTIVPEALDDMSQREAVQYALQQTDHRMSGMRNAYNKQLQMFGEVLDIVLEGHPMQKTVLNAVQYRQQRPNIGFREAFDIVKANQASQENQTLRTQKKRQDKVNRKRAANAKKGSVRPAVAPVHPNPKKVNSIMEAAQLVEKELLGR